MVMSTRYLHKADLLVQVAGFGVRGLHLPGREAERRLLEAMQLLGREGGWLPVRRQGWDDVVVRWLLARHLGASEERGGRLYPCCHY